MPKRSAPFGSWKSPITSQVTAEGLTALSQIAVDSGDIYWIERRSLEGGRSVIVKRSKDGAVVECTPPGFNARNKVHEYGGGDYVVHDGLIFFSNFKDQQIYQHKAGKEPQPITVSGKMRFADPIVDPDRSRLICVREDHSGDGEPVNELVAVNFEKINAGEVLVSGNDFYASPRLSPSGDQLAWLTWNHPYMPWDGTELWLGKLLENGLLDEVKLVAGGPGESITQPEWSPDGILHFVSDRNGWWNLYRWQCGVIEPLCEKEAEFGKQQWIFGQKLYGFVSAAKIICAFQVRGTWRLAGLDTDSRTLKEFQTPYSEILQVAVGADETIFTAASPTEPVSIVRADHNGRNLEILQRGHQISIDPAYLSEPVPIEFPTTGSRSAYGFYYPPRNPDYDASGGEKPPLLVKSHGGPTSATSSALRYEIQFWTSRGFAVLDVNYGGSTGYGRAYRERLKGQWGIVDVDDCTNGARYLVDKGLVDGSRMAITGGSAGGYTTLAALTFGDTFAAGASHFGVSDLAALTEQTHKLESHYLDQLVGPYPEDAAVYHERSPINFVHQLSCPVIFFQGAEDAVVHPDQSERMFESMRDRGIPTAYLLFEGEQHGFRKAENQRRALDGELYFYSRIFGFEPADEIEPVPIENL